MASGVEKNSGLNLLWTNPDPTSEFRPQTVSADLSQYSAILIEFAINTNTGNPTYYSIFANDSSSGHYTLSNINMTSESQGGPPTFIERNVSFTQGGIVFEKGMQKETTASATTAPTVNNVRCIPLKIWGF